MGRLRAGGNRVRHGDTDGLADAVLEVAARLKPMEAHRLLAIEALPRIADPGVLGGRRAVARGQRWGGVRRLHRRAEGAPDRRRRRPARAAAGQERRRDRDADRARRGRSVRGAGGRSREVAVFDGVWPDDAAALAATDRAPARRVPTGLGKLLRRGRLLANRPIRKDLGGKKLYADEGGGFDDYWISTATGRRASHRLVRGGACARPALVPRRKGAAGGRARHAADGYLCPSRGARKSSWPARHKKNGRRGAVRRRRGRSATSRGSRSCSIGSRAMA